MCFLALLITSQSLKMWLFVCGILSLPSRELSYSSGYITIAGEELQN